jgi:hypothetical protein
MPLPSEFRVLMSKCLSYQISLRSVFRVAMSATISAYKSMLGSSSLPVVYRRAHVLVRFVCGVSNKNCSYE